VKPFVTWQEKKSKGEPRARVRTANYGIRTNDDVIQRIVKLRQVRPSFRFLYFRTKLTGFKVHGKLGQSQRFIASLKKNSGG